MKKAIIIGASSGIGAEVAKIMIAQGWQLGVVARREDKLNELKALSPQNVIVQTIDITSEDAADKLRSLFNQLGKVDLILHSSGIGFQNIQLDADIEIKTAQTNVAGFIRIIDTAFNLFKVQGDGHITIISSIAGTKGLGIAPAYSATKKFQNTYIDALEQLSNMQQYHITFTDIRPGFVKTDLLNDGKNYPLLMSAEKVARDIMKAIEKKKRVAIIDWRYRILVVGWRLIPNFIWKRLSIKTN